MFPLSSLTNYKQLLPQCFYQLSAFSPAASPLALSSKILSAANHSVSASIFLSAALQTRECPSPQALLASIKRFRTHRLVARQHAFLDTSRSLLQQTTTSSLISLYRRINRKSQNSSLPPTLSARPLLRMSTRERQLCQGPGTSTLPCARHSTM